MILNLTYLDSKACLSNIGRECYKMITSNVKSAKKIKTEFFFYYLETGKMHEFYFCRKIVIALAHTHTQMERIAEKK